MNEQRKPASTMIPTRRYWRTIVKLTALGVLINLNACLRKKEYSDDLKVATVTQDDLTIDLFYLRGEANVDGVVVWERCIEVSDDHICTPLPTSTKREVPFATFRQRLGESMIKDITVLEFSRSYGQVLGAVMAQDEPVRCPSSLDFVICQHQTFETYNKEYKWLRAAFGVETPNDTGKGNTTTTNNGKPSRPSQDQLPVTNSRDLGLDLEAGKTHTLSINSPAMNSASWSFSIYLPASYRDPRKRFPVLYSLHGGGGDNQSNHFEVNYVIQTNPDTIIVFPNGGRDNFYLDQNVIRQQSQNPDRHIIQELLPYIDDNFKTMKSRVNRAISGFSMGGYGTLHFAFKYPEYFGGMTAMAAGGPYGPGGLVQNYSPQDDPHKLIPANADKIRNKMQIVITVGRQDLYDYNREISDILNNAGISHNFAPLDGVGHDHGKILNNMAAKMYPVILPKSTNSNSDGNPAQKVPGDNPLERRDFCKKYNWDGLSCSEVDISNPSQSSCKWGQKWWCAEGCAKWSWFC